MAAPAPANPIGPALAFAASVAAIAVGLFIIIRFIFAAAPVSVGDDYEFTRLRFAAADYRSLDGWETDSVGEALECHHRDALGDCDAVPTAVERSRAPPG